jgi:ATP-dependent DNA helicase RecG
LGGNQYLRCLSEDWRGIEKIARECREHDIALPVYEFDRSGLMMTFYANPQHLIAALGIEKARLILGERAGEATQKTTQKIPQKTTQKILAVLRRNPSASRREIAEALGSLTEDGVKYQLGKLKSAGIIQRIGPAKGGHWHVKGDDHE